MCTVCEVSGRGSTGNAIAADQRAGLKRTPLAYLKNSMEEVNCQALLEFEMSPTEEGRILD